MNIIFITIGALDIHLIMQEKYYQCNIEHNIHMQGTHL